MRVFVIFGTMLAMAAASLAQIVQTDQVRGGVIGQPEVSAVPRIQRPGRIQLRRTAPVRVLQIPALAGVGYEAEVLVRQALVAPGEDLAAQALAELTDAQKQAVSRIVGLVRSGDDEAAKSRWQQLVTELAQSQEAGQGPSLDQLIQHILQRAFVAPNDGLNAYRREMGALSAPILQQMGRARDILQERSRNQEPGTAFDPVQVQLPRIGRTGGDALTLSFDTIQAKSLAELHACIGWMENMITTVGDDAQLLSLELQNTVNKQQQTIQAMSDIAKALHDEALSIIRNMR